MVSSWSICPRCGWERSTAERQGAAPKKLAVAQFGFGKESIARPRVPQREFLSLPPLSFSSLYLLGLHPTAVDTRRSPATTKDAFQCLVVRATLDDLLCPFPSCTCWPPRPLAGVFFPTSRRRRNELRVAVLSIESALARRLTTDAK